MNKNKPWIYFYYIIMKTPLNNCNPTILDKDTLMTSEWEFMNKESIKERCNCINKSTCLAIVDLLANNKPDLALKQMECLKK